MTVNSANDEPALNSMELEEIKLKEVEFKGADDYDLEQDENNMMALIDKALKANHITSEEILEVRTPFLCIDF